ncbi:MAG: hypothetical protein EAZ65_05670 [Verrucomicrobia bacterium]|nr:MAG: hypothetical protein EAZ82_06355 [Verrucomicrobiota bacterium]TAF25576.1 MAG: hypothetical protein EAZ71_07280 [Verrucomicrobiota bacterium]TAF41357.1 MAG: hypothetical protein EAZ65_05670 [Verrucomicrobiota bacterium]
MEAEDLGYGNAMKKLRPCWIRALRTRGSFKDRERSRCATLRCGGRCGGLGLGLLSSGLLIAQARADGFSVSGGLDSFAMLSEPAALVCAGLLGLILMLRPRR